METETPVPIFDPAVAPEIDPAKPAPRGGGLEGKRVGTLWNGKVGGDKLMRFVLEELRAGGADLRLAIERRKDTDTRPAKPETCDEIARECDFVLISLGD